MQETSKAVDRRLALGHFDLWLHGEGIDVGAGDDPLIVPDGTVRGWDVEDGDGSLLTGVADASLDFVYSSHCLEHLEDVPTALFHWTRVLRPGGRIYATVPDYLLYEKLTWPSRFNPDHKQSFKLDPRLSRRRVGRTNHWVVEEHLVPVLRELGNAVVFHGIEDDGYDYSNGLEDQTRGHAMAQILLVAVKR